MASEQKVAVVTGASQGIGAALAAAYRQRNYRIVAVARSMLPSDDDHVLAVSGDIADRKTAEATIFGAVDRFGRVDTLVNNAGIFISKPFTQYTMADYAAIVGVNLTGFFHMTQLAAAQMAKQGNGPIVQITTSMVDHALTAVPTLLASLTKGGLNAATRSRATEYATRGIRVGNAVRSLQYGRRPTNSHGEVRTQEGDPEAVVPGLMAIGKPRAFRCMARTGLGHQVSVGHHLPGRAAALRAAETLAAGESHAAISKFETHR